MDSLRPGDPRQVGNYVLIGRLGAGGMGEVFFGRSRAGRPVAVKLIHSVLADDAKFRRRFRLEVEAGRKVSGFHTALVVDADPDAERPWVATAYVAGPSLEQVLREDHALPVDSVRVLGAGVSEALGAIHAAGLIHRDLKPSNILLAEDGPRVIDFGIAREASESTGRAGTAGFLAPEVVLGQPLTPACDVFALGVVLAVAAGIRPFGEGPPEVLSYRIVHEEPDLSGLAVQLRDVVAACLAKQPSERPTPAAILELLADRDPQAQWLPSPLQSLITSYAPQREPTAGAATDPTGAARPLEEAGEGSRALSQLERSGQAELNVADRDAEFPSSARLYRPKIFLCYRRQDTQGFARGLYQSLVGEYGHEQVFRDIDSTPAGVRFSTWIESRVSQCNVMIVLIGDAWSSAKDSTGKRRLDSPRDWVRQEIEVALRCDVPIIPVRIQGALMPSEDELPPSIVDLASYQSAEVTDSRWDFDVGLLIRAVDNLIASD
jgi:serine/threonine protein kinase